MRKLVLIAAFALASVSAQGAERIDRVPADNDAPAASATPVATPPAAAPPATADTTKPQATRKQASMKQVYRSRKTQARGREIDEQKARQIAAQYGISW